jgi:hypothetical protein
MQSTRLPVNRSRRAPAQAIIVVGLVLGLGACGHAQSKTTVGAQPAAATATTVGVQQPGDQAAPQDRLGAKKTYAGGQVQFDPPPFTTAARRGRAAVLQNADVKSFYPPAGQYSSSEAKFALFTEYGSGSVGPSGAVVPSHLRQPVWVVTFHNVPDTPSGGGAYSPGSVPPSPPPTALHDIVIIVDDASGSFIQTMSATPGG